MKSTKKNVVENFQTITETLTKREKNAHAEVENEILTEKEAHKYTLIAVEEQMKE